MPLRKKVYKKKAPKKKRAYKKRSLTQRIRRPVIADSSIVRLRYSQSIAIDPGLGAVGTYVFRSNSVYDPDYTGAGHQPYGIDEWANFYSYYAVLGSKCKATFVSAGGTTSTDSATVGILSTRDNAPAVTLDLMNERRNCNWKVMSNSQAKGIVTCYNTYSAKKMFGYSGEAGEDCEGSIGGSNPTKQGYFVVFVSPLNAAYNVSGTSVIVTIDYIVKLKGKKELLQS